MAHNDDDASAHEGPITLAPAININAPGEVGLPTAEFVRYPGCQQLKLWLPLPGHDGYGAWRLVRGEGEVLARDAVARQLSGSVQLLWDTLAWPPGDYRLEIEHSAGWRHQLALHKAQDLDDAQTGAQTGAQTDALAGSLPPPAGDAPAGGGGLEADGLWRRQAAVELAAQLLRRVHWEGQGRAGVLTYEDGPLRIRFAVEMGAGDGRAIVFVPDERAWEAATGLPAARRAEIVAFVARQAAQRFGSRFELLADMIVVC
jgi:hypothetical protein